MTSAIHHEQISARAASRIVFGDSPDTLAAIYDEGTNAAVWVRQAPVLAGSTGIAPPALDLEVGLPADAAADWLAEHLPQEFESLSADIAELAAMYACLFDVAFLGLRLKTLDRPMCPRFHVDRVTCRLLTTYEGAGTEYLLNEDVDRSRLARPAQDPHSPPVLYPAAPVHRLPAGAVALCKGEAWPGNEGAGFVHRSPDPEGAARLVLSIDGLGNDR